MSKFKRILLYFLSLFFLVLVGAALFVPKMIDSKIKEAARNDFSLDISYGNVRIDPFELSAELDNLVLKDANSSALVLSNKKLFLSLSSKTFYLFYPVVKCLEIDGLSVNIQRDVSGKLNLQKYIPVAKKIDSKDSTKPQFFDLKKLSLTNAKIDIKDEVLKIDETISDINLSASNISNVQKNAQSTTDANLTFVAVGARFTMISSLKPFAEIKSAKIKSMLSGLSLERAAKYLPQPFRNISGNVGFSSDITALYDKNINLAIDSKVTFDNPNITIDKRNIKASELVAIVNGSEISLKDGSKKPEVGVKSCTLSAKSLRLSDKNFANELKVSINELGLLLKDFRPLESENTPFKFNVMMAKKSSVSMDGKFNISKKQLSSSIDIKNLSLEPVKSLGILPPKVDFTGGELFANGKIDLLLSGAPLNFSYIGKCGVQNLSIFNKNNNFPVIGFDNLNVNGIDFNLQNKALKIASINIEGLKTNIKIDKQKQLNLALLLENNNTKAFDKNSTQAIKKQDKPFKISIGAVVLQNGSLIFVDEHVAPAFKANLTKLSGRMTSLYLDKDELSKIELIGMFNNQGQINIKGLLVPNPKNFYLNVKSDIRDIGMPSFSTYTSKFIGYEIDSGKLGLELDYNVIGKELSLDNKISLFGFNLGREVESPGAVKLPYNLAIAILKDSDNNIHIELPVEGKTDDPQIRSGKVIWKLVTQLITKVITAPFKFIGSLFGGGDEMGYVEFDYGRSIINAAQGKKIAKIVKALKQKAELKVKIEGFLDGENDYNALKTIAFYRKLATQKLKDLKKPVPLDDIVISSEEHEKYLAKAYKVEKFPKPTNMLGFAKTIPANDMQNLILTHIEVDEKDLTTLAQARADSVKKMIINGGIDASRILSAESKLIAPEQKEKVKNSRAEIKLLLK
jgi:hypothetical protein